MNELIKISDVISVLVNSNIKEMSKSAQNISETICKSIYLDTEMYKSILDIISSSININNILSYSIEKFEEFHKENKNIISNSSINNAFFEAITNFEEFNKEDDNISGSSINNALYKVFRNVEEFHKENNDILNFETYIKNNEEIAYQTNINIENSHNENNICNYKELASDLYFLVKDFITSKIPKGLLIILNKYKNNPTFLVIIIIVFSIIILFTFKIENILKESILVKSTEDTKTIIINQTINNITIINDNKPYYYYIETKDENGNIINGYVSKRKYNKLKSNKTVKK